MRRNIDAARSLCNGARLIARRLHNGSVIEAAIALGDTAVGVASIPRVRLAPADDIFPFDWKRAVNKSQGQTLEQVTAVLR